MRVDTLVLANSAWAKFAQYGAKFSELYSAALRDAGMLCLAIYRRIEDTDSEEVVESEDTGDEATEKVGQSYIQILGSCNPYFVSPFQSWTWENTRLRRRSFVCF